MLGHHGGRQGHSDLRPYPPLFRGERFRCGHRTYCPGVLKVLVGGLTPRKVCRLTLKNNGIEKVRANELARCILHLATEGERDPVRLHDHALATLAPAMMWREPQPSELRT
jgi:hypothetical protein